MTTSKTTAAPGGSVAGATREPLRRSRVFQAALGLITLQLVLHAWVLSQSWFNGDDYIFISRMANGGTPLDQVIEPHGGHVMPGGLYLSWLSDQMAPYDWRINAAMLLVMQAVASAGLLALLLRWFGPRPGILPPLAIYLFTVSGVVATVWWAAAVNALPLQAALFWGLLAHVEHLRTRRALPLVLAVLSVLVGLVFFEKTILVLATFGFVSVAYFATGDLGTRVRTVWDRYRPAMLLYFLLGLAYLAAYVHLALNFSPREAGSDNLGEVISNMVFQTYLPSLVGGPLRWNALGSGVSLPKPTDFVLLASIVVVGLVLREIHRSRTGSLRAWFLPGFFILSDVLLVLAGRVSFIGLEISLEPRYQAELPAVTALALALATMRIKGAVEGAEPRLVDEPSEKRSRPWLLDHPPRVAALTVATVCLGLVSSYQYVNLWSDGLAGKRYFTTLIGELERAEDPIPLIDQGVPGNLLWQLTYPANLLSRLLKHYDDATSYRLIATDDLNMVDSTGRIEPAVVTSVRNNLPAPEAGCGYAVRREPVTIPLTGPVAFGGWWLRVGYLSSGTSPVVVTAGDQSYSTVLRPGVHALYFAGGSNFDSIELSGLAAGVTMCTNDVTVGRPRPLTEPEESGP